MATLERLALAGRAEGPGECVVRRAADGAHALDHARPAAGVGERPARVLRAVVGAHDGAGQDASASFGRGQCVGNQVTYLPGLAMRRIADLYPGEAKTDAKDAAVIADAARTCRTPCAPNRTVFCSGCYVAGPTHPQTCSRRNKRLDTKAFGTPAKESIRTWQAHK